MKKIITITLICASLTLVTELGLAQDSGFGVGGVINGPTGVSYKAWVNQDIAIAGAVSFNIADATSSFYTHVDGLVHDGGENGTFDLESGLMRLYYGGGLQFMFDDLTDDTNFGLRVPVGTTYQFEEAPGDIFFEIVPTVLFDDFNFGLNGALGFRYYLN